VSAGVDALLERTRRIIRRVEPRQAWLAMQQGALLIDTRPEGLRRRDGTMVGSIHVERNVLEWRLDPAGTHRLAGLSGPDHAVIVACDEGYASTLAAASLQAVGLRNVTDLDGGFQAWRRAGLPVEGDGR